MKLLIISCDTDYLERFQYYMSKKYTQIQILNCNSPEKVRTLMTENTFDVMLLDADFDDLKPKELKPDGLNVAFAYISDTNEIINGQDTIFKYLCVSELYNEICNIYEKTKKRVIKTSKPEKSSDKHMEIISFLPVHGGAGSSTMAAACAMSLSENSDVLYINLEQRPSDNVFFAADGKKGLTDIISFLKTKYTDEGVAKFLKSVIQKDKKQQIAKLSFIKGYSNIMDCLSMSEQNLKVILDCLRNNTDFRYVIIDADFIVSPVLRELITSSDKLVFVSSGADISDYKLSKIRRYLEILKRETAEMPENYLILNQYYGTENEQSYAHDMEIVARISRYRTDNNTRITSQSIINQLLSDKNMFAKLKSSEADNTDSTIS